MKEEACRDESGKIIALEAGKLALNVASKGINVVSYCGGKVGYWSLCITLPLSYLYPAPAAVSAILISQSYVVPMATNRIEKLGNKWGEEANEIRERQKKLKEDELNEDWVVDIGKNKSVNVREASVQFQSHSARIKRDESCPSL